MSDRATVGGDFRFRITARGITVRQEETAEIAARADIDEALRGGVRVRPAEYFRDSVITSLDRLTDWLLADADDIGFRINCSATTREGVPAEGETSSEWSTSADAYVIHYAHGESAYYMITRNGGQIHAPKQMETYMAMGTTGNATMIWSARSDGSMTMDIDGKATQQMRISASPSATMSLPGDTAADRLRTLSETDVYTLGVLDSMTLDDVDWIRDESGDDRIDPEIIHGGGG